MIKHLCAVINPAAGQPKRVLHTLNSVCGTAGVDWAVSVTKKSGDAVRFTREALAEGFDVVAASAYCPRPYASWSQGNNLSDRQ